MSINPPSSLTALALAASLLLAGAATARAAECEPGKVAEKYPTLAGKTLKIGADPQTPPYVMRDSADFNKVIGIDADLARAVFDCAGLKYEFFLGGWSGLLPAVMSGQIDVMWDNLYYKPARAETVDFVLYMQAGTGAIVPKGNPLGVKAKADFCGKSVAYGVGSVEEVAVQEQDKLCKAESKGAITTLPFQDLAAGMRLVDSKRTDVLLWDLGFVDATVAANAEKYERAFAIVGTFTIGTAVKKGNDELVKVIADGLQIMQASGKQKEIFKTYSVDPALEVPTEIKTK
jgi:polar amino acid transport system substrate-binding protein